MILIATPARLSTPRALLSMNQRVAHSFASTADYECQLYLNEQPFSTRKYEPNARARNELIERFLRPWHEYVLWLDVDIIHAPENLVEVLLGVIERRGNGNAIAAPMVWVERVGEGAASIPVGGWFYDTGGFQQMDGKFADFEKGIAGDGDEVEMLSVGCVYLAPAHLYRPGPDGRPGLRYRPEGGEVEHLSFMRDARAAGTSVWSTRRANVIHAYLPKWGEGWHSS